MLPTFSLLPFRTTYARKKKMKKRAEETTLSQRQRKNRALGQLYLTAYQNRANDEVKESTSSLIENYEAFLRAPAVFDYFFLVGNLTTLLAYFYETSVKNASDMNAAISSVYSIRYDDRKSIATEMTKLERLMGKAMIRAETNESFKDIVTSQWRKNIKALFENKKKSLAMDRVTLLEEVFEFNLTGRAEQHELYWSGVILEALGERDFYHQQIVRRLEQNATALARHYAIIRNVVCFKALVTLTIWSNAHEGHTFNGDSDTGILVYGDFARDYTVFKALAIKNTSIQLAYIDFGLSRHSDATTLHIKSDKDTRVFDDVFRTGVLELSAMIHATGISNERAQLLADIAEQEKPNKQKTRLSISTSEDDDDDY